MEGEALSPIGMPKKLDSVTYHLDNINLYLIYHAKFFRFCKLRQSTAMLN